MADTRSKGLPQNLGTMELSEPASTFGQIRPEECTVHMFNGLAEVNAAFRRGVLEHWADLMELDRYSTLFQGPEWAMAWYRSYETFEPMVITLACDTQLAGVLPLAVEKATGRLAFCGDGMADYKDIVALPGCRRRLLAEFLKVLKAHLKQGIFSFGSTLPESDTTQLISLLASEIDVRFVTRRHDGWRWWASDAKEEPAKKKTIRRRINHYQGEGELVARIVTSREEWHALKEEFYSQHSLRQLSVGRTVSFDSPQKRAFYDDLFQQPCANFMVMESNRRLIAAHFGCIWHGVLYWGAPAFDVSEKQYSPMLVLLALGIQNRQEWGFPKGVDLTIGTGEMKQRFSTSHVDLPWLDLCGRARDYYQLKLRLSLTRKARQLGNLVHHDSWETQLKPRAGKLVHKLKRAREIGFADSVRRLAVRSIQPIGERGCGLLFTMGPEDLREAEPLLKAGERCAFRENEFRDLLRWKGDSLEISDLISEKVQAIPELREKEKTFHTLLINESLTAWGISYFPKEPALLSESGGATFEFPPGSVSLYDFYVLPQFRGRKLYQSLLVHILRLHFGHGVKQAYVGVAASNVASRKAIERVGFRLIRINTFNRFLKWKKLETKQL